MADIDEEEFSQDCLTHWHAGLRGSECVTMLELHYGLSADISCVRASCPGEG